MKQKLVIIGGTGDFGSWLASFLKENYSQYLDIFISGNDVEKTKKISEKIGVFFYENNKNAVENSDIIVFSVPINKTSQIIKELGSHIKKGSIVLDITSIKKEPSKSLYENVPKECLIIPTHPMFGPGLKSISGQIVVLTPDENILKDYRYEYLKKILNELQAKVIETTPEEHDKIMAVVQGLTHYSMFVIGKTIKKYGLSVLKTLDFVSPIYKLMISSVGRYVGQSPELYADIQMNNDEILQVHDLFNETSNEFNKIVKDKNREEFVEMVLETRKFFGEQNCKTGQGYTDKIIYLLSKQSSNLKKNIGNEIFLENIYSKTTINGILKGFDDHNIFLDDKNLDINEWIIL